MTLTLDDVRNKRFRMARKTGYEVLEVDEFVDEVEESFAQLLEENQNLRRQIEALRQSTPADQHAAAGLLADSDAVPPHGSAAAVVVTTSKEASSAVVRLVELSTAQAEQVVTEAGEDATRIREEASREANQVTTDARTRAERLESEARVTAERLQAEARVRADTLDHDVALRREELLGELERQRDQLTLAVSDLRRFETSFRGNLTDHLRRQIEQLEAGHAEPSEVPELAAAPDAAAQTASGPADGAPAGGDVQSGLGGGSPSDTPRLDALLGDQR